MNIRITGEEVLCVIFEAETEIDEYIINSVMNKKVLHLNGCGVKNVGFSFQEGKRSHISYVWRDPEPT